MLRDYLRRTGVRRQLTIAVSAAILGLALFSSLMTSWEARRRMEGYLVEQGQRIAENLARQSVLALLYHSADNVREGIATTLAFPDVLQVEITDAVHNVLLSQAKTGVTLTPASQYPAPTPVPRAMLESQTGDQWRFGAPVYGGQADASPFDLLEREPQLIGYVYVVVGKGTLNRLIASLLVGNLLITLSFAAVLLGIMRLLAQHMIQSLNALSKLMGRAEAGESGMRAKADGPRDIVEMAHAFNKMMGVLEEREAELKQSRDEALRTALMKAQFAATVSHEVRTPLNGVVGMLDMLKEMRLTKRQQECVDIAWNSSHALIDLINDILDFSKIEAGKLELEEVDFDLRKLVEEVIELLAKQAQQKGLEIGYLLAPGVPDRIKGDSLRLRQVLLNLIGNAVKFTERGEVAVRISSIADSDMAFGLRFEVSDTGIGMEEDTVTHLFQSFVQADRSTTRKYGGTGLGLAISREIVEALGGRIGMEPNPGGGSTFWFTAIFDAPTGIVTDLDDDYARTWLSGQRVLVVDDNEHNRLILEEQLAWWQVRSRSAGSADEAMDLLGAATSEGDPFDAVLLDLVMPGRDGFDLAREVREQPAYADLALLLLSSTDHPQLDRVQHLGIADCLTKPVLSSALRSSLLRVLAGVAPRPSATAPPVAATAPSHRLLVVEDNPVNQMVAVGLLEALGYSAVTADDGMAAINLLGGQRFDAILMDVQMPRMDGYAATREIRAQEAPGTRIPVIAMTAAAVEGERERCLAAGMDDFLTKPVDPSALTNVLDRWLKKEPPMSTPPTHPADGTDDGPENGTEDCTEGLDLARIDELRDLDPGNTTYLDRAIGNFVTNTPVTMATIREALEADDAATLKAVSHKLAGGALNLGATHAGRVALEIEAVADSGSTAAAAELVELLDAGLARARTALLAYQADYSRGPDS
jgi:signal transduction histidine kinase/DNA-binding response OmpR family regulator/HPt (histidine-containing phosphotransfer) domain-containing protein